MTMALGRNNASKIVQIELHDVKFVRTMHSRNWNRTCHPFIGHYYQRGDIFKFDCQCNEMRDDEHVLCCKNAVDEWEHELSANADHSIGNHKD